MKKDRLFGKFYFESLRQTRIVGIIFTVILTVASLAMTIGQYISALTGYLQLKSQGFECSFGPEIITFQELNPLQSTLTFLMAPLLVLMAFSFLNKRASSDFYHSVTQKRSTVFMSYSLSCITWIIFSAIISTLAGIIAAQCCGNYYVINWNTFIFLAERLISAFYVIAATALAMTLTGTLLNNVVVTGMIIFVPRILMSVIASALVSVVRVLPGIEQLGILDPRFNLVCGDILYILYEMTESTVYNAVPMIYTATLGIVYFILAYIVFCVRPSESAGLSAPSRFLQALYRIAFTMVICSIACILIFGMVNSSFNTDDVILIVIIYVFALIAWFVYELITTRRPSNLLKTIPSLSIVAVLNVALILTMVGIKSGIERFRPDANEIEYIKISEQDYNFYNYERISLYEYLIGDINEIKITDEKVKEIVSENLKNTLDNDGYYYKSIVSSSTEYINYTNITVGIKTSAGLKYRIIEIPSVQADAIGKTLNETIAGERELNKLPQPDDVYFNSYIDITEEQCKVLYRTLIDEIASMDKVELLEILSNDSNSITYFTITTTQGLNELTINIPLSPDFEKTAQKYFELIDSDNEIKKLLNLKSSDDFSNMSESYVSIEIYDGGIMTHSWYGSLSVLSENGMFDILANEIDKTVDPAEMIAYVNISFYDINEDEYHNASRYISLADVEMTDIPVEIRTSIIE